MSLYTLALFLHIVGALLLFAALGLEWAGLLRWRHVSTAEQVGEWMSVFAWLRQLYSLAWLIILLPGLYMTATVWGWLGWNGVALVAIVALGVAGAVLGRRYMMPIGQAAAGERGAISAELRDLLRQPGLWLSLRVRTALALGIVFLMAVKPGWIGALVTMGVAAVLGLITALPAQARARSQGLAARPGD